MLNLVDIIGNLINGVGLVIQVNSIAGSQVFVCDTLFITVGKIVTDSLGQEYRVTNMLINEWLELTPYGHAVPFNDTIINAPSITYLHGTPQTVNNEYLQINQTTLSKTPFIWLLENYQYEQPEADSSLGAIFDVVLFALDWCDEPKWTNGEQNELVIKPMENLVDAIIESINQDFQFVTLRNVIKKPRSRFGVYVTNKGNKEKIFNEDLSGVETRFQLEVYDLAECNC